MTKQEKESNKLNELLRGERSAMETYSTAIDKIDGDSRVDSLLRIKQDHHQAVTDLSARVAAHGKKPSSDSGAWGTWAKSVVNTASLFGDKSALTALKKGEEHGLKEFESAIGDESLSLETRDQIRQTYIPRQREHIQTIDRLIERVAS